MIPPPVSVTVPVDARGDGLGVGDGFLIIIAGGKVAGLELVLLAVYGRGGLEGRGGGSFGLGEGGWQRGNRGVVRGRIWRARFRVNMFPI